MSSGFAVSSIHSLLTNLQICASAMLSLLIVGNWRKRSHWGGLHLLSRYNSRGKMNALT